MPNEKHDVGGRGRVPSQAAAHPLRQFRANVGMRSAGQGFAAVVQQRRQHQLFRMPQLLHDAAAFPPIVAVLTGRRVPSRFVVGQLVQIADNVERVLSRP